MRPAARGRRRGFCVRQFGISELEKKRSRGFVSCKAGRAGRWVGLGRRVMREFKRDWQGDDDERCWLRRHHFQTAIN